jgi:hypothetical protein
MNKPLVLQRTAHKKTAPWPNCRELLSIPRGCFMRIPIIALFLSPGNTARCLIINLTQKEKCLKIKILPKYAYPGEGPDSSDGIYYKGKTGFDREYAP